GPLEPRNEDIAGFYDRLLETLSEHEALRHGAWSLISPEPAWSDNPTWQEFIAYAWRGPQGSRYVVVINYSGHHAQCHLRLPFTGPAGSQLRLTDGRGSEIYDRDGGDLVDPGLYIDLGAWGYNIFKLEPFRF